MASWRRKSPLEDSFSAEWNDGLFSAKVILYISASAFTALIFFSYSSQTEA